MPGDLIGDRGQVGVGRAIGGESRDADFERAPRFEHLAAREPMERREETERFTVEDRRAVGDEGAGTVPNDDHTLGGERLEPGADGRATDAEGSDQFTFGRQAAARAGAHR